MSYIGHSIFYTDKDIEGDSWAKNGFPVISLSKSPQPGLSGGQVCRNASLHLVSSWVWASWVPAGTGEDEDEGECQFSRRPSLVPRVSFLSGGLFWIDFQSCFWEPLPPSISWGQSLLQQSWLGTLKFPPSTHALVTSTWSLNVSCSMSFWVSTVLQLWLQNTKSSKNA